MSYARFCILSRNRSGCRLMECQPWIAMKHSGCSMVEKEGVAVSNKRRAAGGRERPTSPSPRIDYVRAAQSRSVPDIYNITGNHGRTHVTTTTKMIIRRFANNDPETFRRTRPIHQYQTEAGNHRWKNLLDLSERKISEQKHSFYSRLVLLSIPMFRNRRCVKSFTLDIMTFL